MITEIIMPKMSNTMTEGRVMKWYKKENEFVQSGETIVEIMTDKINREVEATDSGYVRKIIVGESNDFIKIGEIIGLMSDTKEEIIPAKYLNENNGTNIKTKIKITPKAKKLAEELGLDISLISYENEAITEKDVLNMKNNENIKVTPLAKKVSEINSIQLEGIKGTGINGKIVKKDVDTLLNKELGIEDKVEYELEPIIGMRGIIAERMSKSKFTAPHVYFFKEINMEKCVEFREILNKQLKIDGYKISITDFIAYAVIKSLKIHSNINICVEENTIKKYSNVNISLAVDTDRGLMVPVIKKSDKLSLYELSKEIRNLIQKTRDNKLELDDLSGGSFTISNLGSFDSDFFTAIINAPQGAILAVSSIKKKAVVVNDEICIKPMMNIALTVDHRAIDGVAATKFINEIKDKLENPELLLM